MQQKYTLGLDIGMASVGAALLADEQIIALHVRTFDKAETAKEGNALNLIRREARLVRRRLRRKVFRLLRLTRLFKRKGLIAEATPQSFMLTVSPWQLRAEGLERVLTPQEWASVIYHIVKHRGFLSNRKSEVATDEKAGQMLSGVSENKQKMLAGHYRTMGEMVMNDPTFIHAKRNKGGDYSHTFARLDLKDEIEHLFAAQRSLGNTFTDIDFEASVITLLMARKPTLSGDNLLKMIGKCTFELNEYRAPKSSHSAEWFVWLTKLNNLRVTFQGSTRGLTDIERSDEVIILPFTQAKVTYKQLRKKLQLDPLYQFVGLNYKDGDPESKTLFEAKGFHALSKAYEKAGLTDLWQRDKTDDARLNLLAYAQTVFKDDNEARSYLQAQHVEDAIIEAVLVVSFSEFIRLSIKALDKIKPFMAMGMRYDEAVIAAGYQHHSNLRTGEKSKYLPQISKEDIPNPVVYRALNQARKLVNAIVKKYGAPMAVNIELARDLSKPFDERKKIEKEQEKYRENKERDFLFFKDVFKREPQGSDLQKFRLFREQASQCAYTQRPLDAERLFEIGYAEIDHALPYSRSFDDGNNNRVLVLTAENRNKGNRTPYEYLDGANDSEQWRRFVAFVESNKNYRQAKKSRLLKKNFTGDESKGFKERNLTDTRYICKKFAEQIETHLQLHPDSNVRRCTVVAGQLTSLLRTRWGLLKVREDGDLHHALDAAVIAACTPRMVQLMARYAQRKELQNVRQGYTDPETGEVLNASLEEALNEHFPQPWHNFRHELLARLSDNPSEFCGEDAQPIRVSRACKRRGLGAAHHETIRSAKKYLSDRKSTIKTPLTSLKLKDLPNIVGKYLPNNVEDEDPRNQPLINAIRQRLEAHNDDGAKAFATPLYKPASAGKEHLAPVVKSVYLQTVQKSGLPVRKGIANNGDMLRLDIFSKAGKFYAVPLYVADAVEPTLPNKASVQSKPDTEWPEMDDTFTFKFSLYRNDWLNITFKNGECKQGYYAGFGRATASVNLWAHDRNRHAGKDGLMSSIGIKTALTLEKYHVDMLGNLHPVLAEERQPLFSPKRKKAQ